jgi:hypothetical protein
MTTGDVHTEYRALVRAHPDHDHSGWLRTRLSQVAVSEDRETIAVFLVHELQRTEQFAAAEALLREDIAQHPRHPYPLIALAEHYHYFVGDLRRAKVLIARAAAKARAIREFVYHSLGVQARLAIETQDWKLLERSLRELTAYRHKTGNPDVFPEKDFLARILPNTVSPEAVAAYIRRRKYLSAIGYSTLTGRSTGRADS